MATEPQRSCSVCKQTKPLDLTHFENHPHGYRHTCRECRKAAGRVLVKKAPRTLPAAARFLAEVDKQGPDECWRWMGARNGNYGCFHPASGETELSHRYSYRAFVGHIPSGMNVNHECDVCLCVNPSHLWVGTQAQNVHDCRAKGRHDRKLGAEQVLEMRRLRKEYGATFTELAKRYHVTAACVRHAVIRRTWSQL